MSAQYRVRCTSQVLKELHKLDADRQTQIEHVFDDVASTRQISNHSKCAVLDNGHSETLYKIRVGDYRAIAELDKPMLKILKFGERSTVYDGLNDIYNDL